MKHHVPKPLQVYLDTSVFNFAISTQDVPREREATLKFLDKLNNGLFWAYVSDTVFEEIYRASPKKQDDFLKLISDFELEILPLTDEVKVLADRYIEKK